MFIQNTIRYYKYISTEYKKLCKKIEKENYGRKIMEEKLWKN